MNAIDIKSQQGSVNMDCYPEYYYSNDLRAILSQQPQLPLAPIAPPKPIEPNKSSERSDGNHVLILLLLVIAAIGLFAVLCSDLDHKVGYCFVCCIFMLFSIFFLKTERWDKERIGRKTCDNNLDDDYKMRLSQYQKDYEQYQKQKEAYEQCVESLKSGDALSRYRIEAINKWRTDRVAPLFQHCAEGEMIPRGVSEPFFLNRLRSMGFTVYDDVKIPVGGKFYYPDFLIESDGLYIDIEIDEPYTSNDGEPIHYLNDNMEDCESVDAERNSFLSEKGFEVIRFSEEQVFLKTSRCLLFIMQFINRIRAGGKTPPCSQSFTKNKWTKEQAEKMAQEGFRDTYIPPDVKHKAV